MCLIGNVCLNIQYQLECTFSWTRMTYIHTYSRHIFVNQLDAFWAMDVRTCGSLIDLIIDCVKLITNWSLTTRQITAQSAKPFPRCETRSSSALVDMHICTWACVVHPSEPTHDLCDLHHYLVSNHTLKFGRNRPSHSWVTHIAYRSSLTLFPAAHIRVCPLFFLFFFLERTLPLASRHARINK